MSGASEGSDEHDEAQNGAQLRNAPYSEQRDTISQRDSSNNSPGRKYSDQYTSGSFRTNSNPRAYESSATVRGGTGHLRKNEGNSSSYNYSELRHPGGVTKSFDAINSVYDGSLVAKNQILERRYDPAVNILPTRGADYKSSSIRQTGFRNPRSRVIDINITIGAGGRVSHTVGGATSIASTSALRPQAKFDNVRVVDLDFRTPGRVATVSTDGHILSSS